MRNTSTTKAAKELADLAGKHLASLSPSKRAAKLTAFQKVISEVREDRSKPTKPSRTQPNRRATRARG